MHLLQKDKLDPLTSQGCWMLTLPSPPANLFLSQLKWSLAKLIFHTEKATCLLHAWKPLEKHWSSFLVAMHFYCRKSLFGEWSHLPWYLCFVFTASVLKYSRNLVLKAIDHMNILSSPHSSLSYVSHTDWCWSIFNSPPVPGACWSLCSSGHHSQPCSFPNQWLHKSRKVETDHCALLVPTAVTLEHKD